MCASVNLAVNLKELVGPRIFGPRSGSVPCLFPVTPVSQSLPELRPGLRCLPHCRIPIHTLAFFQGLRAHHSIHSNAVKFCGHVLGRTVAAVKGAENFVNGKFIIVRVCDFTAHPIRVFCFNLSALKYSVHVDLVRHDFFHQTSGRNDQEGVTSAPKL